MSSRIMDLLVVVGPSGVGKSTLISRLIKEFPESFGYSVSHTTRQARAGEENGVSYHFVDTDNFKELVGKGEFLEHAVVHDTWYGTSEASVRKVLAEDRICFMDLDIVGAQNLKKHPTLRSMVVFVIPPSFEILEARLTARGTETQAKIQKRLADGKEWVQWFQDHKEFFDFHCTNDNLDSCYEDFRHAIMTACFDVNVDLHSR
ncbi:guanylate kinase, putative [Bodo saltans]|uniref:guanylate kinase n=1 Tax=Bodo saltans TaxID=75058 RepID=A0A0S4JM12_BODSA|nr:guanylate kinase, putative [Bodo saltans]|eukprot:CUG91220.1 guanylate kinase, putative [Bodo saltans]